jgi:hypothetical protein
MQKIEIPFEPKTGHLCKVNLGTTLQKAGRRVFQSDEAKRLDRERLLRKGFVQEVMKGWLISSSPSARKDDSRPWYASFSGILRPLLSGPVRRRLVSVAGAITPAPRRKHGHPDAGCHLLTEGDE